MDINTSIDLASTINDNDIVLVSESGISSSSDIITLNSSGIYTFLVGEHLIKSTNASEEIGEFINA